jgi:diguanylate cyclase (GGDEF)-like protein/PAS domain S-box-containing protein
MTAAGKAEDAPASLTLGIYAAAFATTSCALCVEDAALGVVLVNARFVEMLELPPVRPGARLADVADDPLWRQRAARMAQGTPFVTRHRLAGGRAVEIECRPLPGGGWVTTCLDITEREAEQALCDKVERLDLAVGNMAHGLCMFDAEERMVLCNEQYFRIYGHQSRGHIKPGATYREILEYAVATGNHGTMTADELYAMRMAVIRLREVASQQLRLDDGRVIEMTVRPIEGGGWVADHEDVTARVRYQEALREQSLLFDAALENMPHGLCAYDQDLRVIVRNQRYLDIYGLKPDEVRPGTPAIDMFRLSVARGVHLPTVSPEQILEDFRRRLNDKEDAVLHRRLADGRVIAVRHRPMANGGWVGTYEDITERERAAEQIREQNLRFDVALNNISRGLCMFDADQRLLVCNDEYVSIFGADPSVVRPGILLREIFEHGVARGTYPGLTADQLLERRLATIAEQRPVSYDQPMADGRTILVSICPMANGGWVATFEDVTERRKMEAERAAAVTLLKEQYLRFDAALNNMSHGLFMLDADLRLIVCNRRYIKMYDLSPDVVRPGASIRDLLEHSVALGNHPGITAEELYQDYLKRISGGGATYHRHLADGRVIKIVHQRMMHGGWVATHEDITERYRAEEHIARMARHDALTDLPNRVLLHEKMAEGLERVAAQVHSMAVLCLDLDNFKTVNDTLGHPIGDKLLRAVAERLGSGVRETDTVARLGGDEFAILHAAADRSSSEALARRLVEIMATPIVIDGHEINTGISIGVAVAPDHGLAGDHLMKCADLALYHAKASGRGTFRFFEPDMDARIQARRALELDLRQALASGSFELAYQPQVRLANNELTGMEALLRWTRAGGGPVPPAEFIPIAEETGLIVPLGEWVLRTACAEAARWPDHIRVAVNLSPAQFRGRGLVSMVTHALAASGLPARRLELEITEAVLLRDDEAIRTTLHQLRALGVRISMDDFGTGYSSLSYLRSFPFDKIKIDRSFISDIDRNRDNVAIIQAVARLGASLGIETTAEGIETHDQLELVRSAGCTEVQGYLVSPPCSAAMAFDLIGNFLRDDVAA